MPSNTEQQQCDALNRVNGVIVRCDDPKGHRGRHVWWVPGPGEPKQSPNWNVDTDPLQPSAESGERQYPEWDSGGHCHSCGGWSVPEPGDRIPIDTVSDGKGHLQDCPWNTTPAIAPAPADDPLAAALEVLEGVVQPSDVVQSRIAAIQLSVRLAPVALRELMAWRACADDPFEDLDTLDAFRAHANRLGVALDEARAATDRALGGCGKTLLPETPDAD